jgi:hypothetical protein
MKTNVIIISLITIVVVLAGCSGSKVETGGMKVVTTPYDQLNVKAMDLVANGTVAVVGQGTSTREDMARDKALQTGMAGLATALEAEVKVLTKQFNEEIGSLSDAEINESFQRVSSTLAKTILKGAIPKESVVTHNGKSGKESIYKVYTIVAVDSKVIVQSFQDQMKKEEVLYTRYLHSKMDAEMEEKLKDNGKE